MTHIMSNDHTTQLIETINHKEDFRVSFDIFKNETTGNYHVALNYDGADDSCDPDAVDVSYDYTYAEYFKTLEAAKQFVNTKQQVECKPNRGPAYTETQVHFVSWYDSTKHRRLRQHFDNIYDRQDWYETLPKSKTRSDFKFWTETYKVPTGEL